jgi:hypothetical protein
VIDLSICFDIFSRERNPFRQDGIARNRRRKRNENTEGKGEMRLEITDKKYMEVHKREKLKSRDGQMLHNEWVGFHEGGKRFKLVLGLL